MLLTGTFKTIDNSSTIRVDIYKYEAGALSTTYNISDEKLDTTHHFCFKKDPIKIKHSFDDFFSPIITTSCTIKLISNIWCGDMLYATNYEDIVCRIMKDQEVLFLGFVEPRTYNQDINAKTNEIQIKCVDWLSVLSEYTYADYASAISSAQSKSFQEIFLSIFNKQIDILNATTGTTDSYSLTTYMDSNIRATIDGVLSSMKDLKVSELVFFGDSEDDMWHYDEVVKSLLMYMNARIVSSNGQYIFILSNDITGSYSTMINLNTNIESTASISSTLTNGHIAKEQVSLDDIYNQIGVKCNIETVDDVVASPLKDDDLDSPYTNLQIYMREYSGKGDGYGNYHNYCRMVLGSFNGNDNNDCWYRDWYIRYLENAKWTCNNGFYTSETLHNRFPYYLGDNYINQHRVSYDLGYDWAGSTGAWHVVRRNSIGGPYFVELGNSKEYRRDDSSPDGYPKMSKYLVIPTMGLWYDNNNDATAISEYHTILEQYNSNPMVTYNSGTYMNLTPPSSSTKYYIIFSGKLRHNPLWQGGQASGQVQGLLPDYYRNHMTWESVQEDCDDDLDEGDVKPARWAKYNGENRPYYQRYFYRTNPSVGSYYDVPRNETFGLVPPIDNSSLEMFEYEYTKISDTSGVIIDGVYKVPVLCCRMQIGNKYLKENLNASTGKSTYSWVTDSNATFSLGFDPKVGDKIINKEYEISNNITPDMNIDQKGTAIPCLLSDNLHGIVKFEILGPYNSTWNETTRKTHSWWNRLWTGNPAEEYTTNTRSILNRTQCIYISDFKCVAASDAGKNDTKNDNDLMYLSVNNNNFKNPKTDIDFDIYTSINSDEAFNLGVASGVSTANTMTPSNNVFLTDYNARPEVLYVQTLFDLYSEPKKIIEYECDYIESFSEIYRMKIESDVMAHLGIANIDTIATNSEMSPYKNRIKITLREI